MKISVCTVSIPDYTPAAAVRLLSEAGYEGVEWRVIDQQPSGGPPGFWAGNQCTWSFSTFVGDVPTIRALTEGAGLKAPVVGTYCTCLEPAETEQAMQGAASLEAPMLRVRCPSYDGVSSFRDLWARCRVGYREVAALANRYGVRAILETHNGTAACSASAAAALLDGLDPACVGAIYDPGCMVIEGYEQVRMGLEILSPYLAHVHLKNEAWFPAGQRADGSTVWQARAVPLDRGQVDVPELFAALRAVGYDGWISLEDFSTELPTAERLVYNLAYVRRTLEAVA